MACLASTPVIAPARLARVISGRGARGTCRRGGLVVVAGKKGAWAKEFDPEYEKAQAVVEVDASIWPGLESASHAQSFRPLVPYRYA